MNTIYNVVWNSTTNTWVVASEMAKGRKKQSRTVTAAGAAAFAAAGVAISAGAFAQTVVGSTTALGNGAVASSGNTTAIGSGAKASKENANAVGAGARADGVDANAFGTGAFASAAHAIAIGPSAQASGLESVAIGSGTSATKANGVAVGNGANATGDNAAAFGAAEAAALRASAFGWGAKALARDATAVGSGALASGVAGVSMGLDAVASGPVGTAIGSMSRATADNATALGFLSVASGVNATTLGNQVEAKGVGSIAIQGNFESHVAVDAASKDAIAIGTLSKVTNAENGVAIGAAAEAAALRAAALGFGAKALAVDASAFGTNAIASATDSTAIGDTAKATGFAAQALGTWSEASGVGSTAVGVFANASGQDSTAVGSRSKASDLNASAFGTRAQASARDATAVGFQATASGVQSAAFGERAVADADYSVAVGSESKAQGKYATAIGVLAKAGQQSLALGDSAGSKALQAISIGSLSRANNDFAVAIGADSEAATSGTAIGRQSKASANSVALGAGSVADRDRSVSVGTAGSERQITHLAKGTADTDGVNVSQLKGVATAIGGGTAVNPDGSIEAPEFNVGGKTVNNVGEAIDGLDNIVKESGLVDPATGKAQKAVTFNGPNGEANVAGQKIINVAAGTADTDAVNVKQIKDSGLIDPSTGKVQKAVLFNGPNGEANAAGQKFINLAKGTADTDGVNVSQLKGVTDVIGAGAGINPDGTVKAPEFNVGDKKVGTVGEAIDGLDNIVKESGLVDPTTGKAQKAVLFNGPNGEANVAGTKIINVGEGALNANSKDAVNGSQLFATNQTVGAVQNTVNNITNGSGIKYFHTNSKLADSQAGGTDAIAVGGGASAGANRGIAIGTNANASAANSIALGTNSIGDRANSLSLGSAGNERQLINLAKGTADTDGVNVSQLKGVTNVIGAGAGINPDGTVKAPEFTVGGKQVDNVGAAIDGLDKIATDSGLIDPETGEAQKAVLFNGPNGEANVAGTKIINVAAGTGNTDAVNIAQLKPVIDGLGGGAKIDPTTGAVTGPTYVITNPDGSTTTVNNAGDAITNVTNHINNGTVGLVQQAAKGQRLTVGKATDGTEVNFTGTAGDRKLTGVAAGTVSAASTDGVNGSQLFGTAQSVAKAIGGGAVVNPDGTVKAPEFTVDGKKVDNVGAAIDGLGDIVEGNTTNITNVMNGKVGLVQQAAPGQKLTVGKDTDGTQVDFNGTAGARQLTNVANGLADRDAVNASQLRSAGFVLDKTGNVTNAAVTYTPGSIASGSPTVVLEKGTGDSAYFVDGDRTKGRLPKGTLISNVANAVQDTDATNLGLVKDIVSEATDNQASSRRSPRSLLAEAVVVSDDVATLAAGDGSGVDGTGLTTAYKTAAYYSQVAGKGDHTGSAPPSDVSRAAGAGSIAVGSNAFASADRSTAVGLQAHTAAAASDAVALGAGSVATEANTISIGNDGTGEYTAFDAEGRPYTIKNQANTRRLVNMAAGQLDTDGVNVSQLKGVTDAIGGGAAVGPDGKVTGPSISVGGNKYDNITDAISAIDGKATTGNPLGVAYDSAAKDKVTLNNGGAPVTISNVKEGVADNDAVNVKQLKDTGLIDPETGEAQKAVLFNGPNGEANVAGTKIVNVAAGTANTDGVNVSQLKGVTDAIGAGAGVNPDGTIKKPTINVGGKDFGTIGEAISAIDAKAVTGNPLGVAYDSTAKDKVTLNNGGAPVTVSNVKEGVADNDAVNVKQLKDTGLIDPETGEAQKAVLFNGPNSEANVAGTKIVNVAAGTVGAASTDAINGSQLFGTAQSVAKAIGGGSVVNPDGTVKAPEFTVGGKKVDNVGSAIDGLDKIATDSGLIDPVTGKAQKAVLFNGPNGEANVAGTKIVNVAAGTGNTDAVNIAQLKPVIDGLGGGAKIDPTTGAVTGPTYVITNPDGSTTTVNNAGDAITSVTNHINNGTVGLVQQAAKGQRLTVGKATDGSEVNFTGTAGDRKLTGVAKGTADTDAVNVSQLKDTGLIDPTTGKAQKAVLFNGPNGEANVAGTRIVNVGAGTVNAASTDAINGSQLFGVSKSVSESLGGGSKVNPDGSITGPTYVITKPDGSTTTVNNVGDAITNITNNISSGTVGLVQQAAKGEKLTVGKATDGREVDFTGTAGDRKLSGVANGTAGNNAVNVSQLKPIIDGMGGGAKIDPTTGTVTGPTYVVTNPDGSTTTVNNAGDAITHVDGRVTNITNNISNGTLGLVQQAGKGEKLTVGKDTDGAEVNFTGTGGDRKLTGVAKGTADTDAVNVSQLKGTGLIDPVTGEAQKAVLFNGPNGEANVAGTKIVNVAAGTVGADSKDAINGGQLFGTAQSVAGALGGGSKVNPDGTITNPTYTVHKADGSSTTVNNVGDAITNVDGRVTNITNTINSGGIGLVQQAGKGANLTVGKDTDGSEVNFTGTAGDRKLSGVAKGTADNDAVNVSQLKETGLIDGDGKVANVVTYDSADKDSITLGGKNPTKKVKVKNVADATADDEAVNLGQLKGTGLVDGNGKALDAVVYDAGSQKGAVTFGGANGTVLNNVADGRIESGSRQAINGGQIAALKDQLQGHITNIDGRVTKIEQNGGIGGTPDFVKAQGAAQPAPRGEPAAVAAENGAALGYNATAGAKGATAVGDGAKAMAADGVAVGSKARVEEPATNSVALGSGSVADRANTVSVGSAGQTRAITNVAAGTADHDAVNVTQLNQRLADANRYTDKAIDDVWSNLTHEIDEANTQGNRGIAAASALINVTPYLPGRTAVNAGVASYRGETALGVGVSRWSENGRVNLNAGVSAAQGDEPVFRVGVGYVF
ncbi:YadA-like family protein [Lysobacter sp. GCM10012299]|uniref:YadA-like family protein n=1 Tax=Lysobacter sp. GCM10012299 TaxID=3317333 RepID=UPI003609E366